MLGALAVALLLLDKLGFVIVVTVFMAVVMFSLGVRSWRMLATVPVLTAIGLYVVFAVWLQRAAAQGRARCSSNEIADPPEIRMDFLSNLSVGFAIAFSPINLFVVTIGVVVGTLIGALPGIGPVAGLSILIPLAIGMDPTSAMILMCGIYSGCMYGGTQGHHPPGIRARGRRGRCQRGPARRRLRGGDLPRAPPRDRARRDPGRVPGRADEQGDRRLRGQGRLDAPDPSRQGHARLVRDRRRAPADRLRGSVVGEDCVAPSRSRWRSSVTARPTSAPSTRRSTSLPCGSSRCCSSARTTSTWSTRRSGR